MPGRSSLTWWSHKNTHTKSDSSSQYTGYFIVLSAVSVAVSSLPPQPHTLMVVADLKRRGRTGDVETDGCWHQLKTQCLTLMGPERDAEGRPHLGLIPLNQPTAKHEFRNRQ